MAVMHIYIPVTVCPHNQTSMTRNVSLYVSECTDVYLQNVLRRCVDGLYCVVCVCMCMCVQMFAMCSGICRYLIGP